MEKPSRNKQDEEQLPAVLIDGVSKYFLLPHERSSSLKSSLLGLFKTKRAKRVMEHQHVLDDISLRVNKGEFVGIVGRNGSGKSTLLKIIAGIYRPSSGTVEVSGRLVPFIELGVGFNGELTARENIYLNGAVLGYSRDEIDKRLDEIIEFAELRRFVDQKLKNYSSGMQVRLAFSVATRLSESDILLIDEVLAVGDAAFQKKCYQYFMKLKRQGKTVILVTHDMNAVREYCTRAILIEKSRIVQEGTTEDIASAYSSLFDEERKIEEVRDQEPKRRGDGAMKFTEIVFSKDRLSTDDTSLALDTHLEVYKDIEKPIFGISIMNKAGQRIFGTNTDLQRMKLTKLRRGEKYIINWVLPNIFNDGQYDVCLSAASPMGVSHDSWDCAAPFLVNKEMSTSYPVDPPITITIRDKFTQS